MKTFSWCLDARKLKTEQKLIVLSCLHPPPYLFWKKIGTQSNSTNFLNWGDHVNSIPDLAARTPPLPDPSFIRSELFHFWKWYDPRITQSRCKFGVTWREACFHEIYAWHVSESREWSTILRNKNMLIWKVMNPFITCWDGPFAGKEKRVFDICVHGLNNDRAVRSISRASCTFHAELQMYFTLASVARKEIMVRSRKANFVKTIV